MPTIQPFTKLVVFLAVSIALASATLQSAEGQLAASENESELLAVLQSDAPPAEKAITCKRLAIYGSDAAIPELAKLLSDPQLASWSRIALEAIPGPAADRVLRESLDSLEGKLLVGAINSIGVRRDVEAVDQLSDLLQDEDNDVASAAAVALGRIGNKPATKSLRTALASAPDKVRSAVAEGCVLCAERLHASGESEAATEIYDQVRTADVPQQRIIEATRGAILTRNQAGIPLLLETLRSPEKEMFQLALGTIREFPGSEVDEALAAELASATPARAALIVQAMADRPDTVVLAAVLKAAGEGNNEVRISAIDALRRVGDQSCLSVLLQTATEDDEELASAAKETLAGLPGAKIDTEIASMLPNASENLQSLLLQLIGQRRIGAVDDVVAALGHSDPKVRSAALYALGETVTLDDLPVLISQAISPKHPDDAESAQQALMVASVRMPDRDKCTTELVKAMKQAPSGTKTTLLEIVGAVGGSAALNALAEAAKSDDPELQDASSRLLGKWNSIDAAPVLLDLAKTAPAERFRIRALRGYLGIARKFPMPEPQRAEMCQKAMDASSRLDEQRLALEVLKIHPSQAGLSLAKEAQKIPALKDEATATAQAISKELGR